MVPSTLNGPCEVQIKTDITLKCCVNIKKDLKYSLPIRQKPRFIPRCFKEPVLLPAGSLLTEAQVQKAAWIARNIQISRILRKRDPDSITYMA